jgi:Domain of unknown function (DUF4382)
VHRSGDAGEGEAGWSEIVLSPPQRVNLLELTNGILLELGSVSLPAGKYTQLRLVLAPNDSGYPPANSVLPSGTATEIALSTPSGQQSGLKANIDIDVAAGQVADFVVDFDACKSVVKRGNSGLYNLKPVITVIPRLADAGHRVVGYVSPALAAAGANVSVQMNGVPVKATVPNPVSGRFDLVPVPQGSYDLVVAANGYATAVMTGVPVQTAVPTTVGTEAMRIDTPVSLMRAAEGTVNPATATVRALQSLTNGPTVEVAWAPVNALGGGFAFTLPIAAPLRTSYPSPSPFSLGFTVDAPVGGLYTIEAASAGATKTVAVNANSIPVPQLAFVFP